MSIEDQQTEISELLNQHPKWDIRPPDGHDGWRVYPAYVAAGCGASSEYSLAAALRLSLRRIVAARRGAGHEALRAMKCQEGLAK